MMSNHLLLEIGMEELPARFIDNAQNQLVSKTTSWLQEQNIPFETIQSFSTPRRLAIIIKNIASYQKTITEEVRGPQLKIAKDASGNWTKAAIGFSKGQGKDPDDIYEKEIKGTPYIFVEKKTEGKETAKILPGLKDIIAAIQFPQTMRWGSGSYRFSRPIRWIVALFNNQVIPFEVANVKTSNITYGHRFLGKTSEITDPLQYEDILKQNYVIADPEKREQLIVEQIKKLEKEYDFQVVVSESLLNEVRNLVEYPTAFHGTFAEEYLQLPKETLVTSMQEHQRYFPVMKNNEQSLLPYFVSVRNGDDVELNNVIRGNEKVLRARLADAAFFYEEDRNHSIDFYMDKLKTVVFQEKIGTVYEKTNNIKSITSILNEKLEVNKVISEQALRAAEICKFDLVTEMVNEFPELQGIMGEKYALHYGEDATVAEAIREHYLPIQANGTLPSTTVGSIVSVADKLDTIVSSISVGLIPTGSQDPYGLRRQAIGVLRILLEEKWDVTIESLVEMVSETIGLEDESVLKELNSFFYSRAAFILAEQGIEQDIVRAVLAGGIGVLNYTIDKAKLLSNKRNDPAFKQIEEALVRVMNLSKKSTDAKIDPSLFETSSEKALYDTYNEVNNKFSQYDKQFDALNALSQLERLAQPIHEFFEHNMVMAEDERVKENRLALVNYISQLIKSYADVTLIEWKQHH